MKVGKVHMLLHFTQKQIALHLVSKERDFTYSCTMFSTQELHHEQQHHTQRAKHHARY
jgi:hypothetical protein